MTVPRWWLAVVTALIVLAVLVPQRHTPTVQLCASTCPTHEATP